MVPYLVSEKSGISKFICCVVGGIFFDFKPKNGIFVLFLLKTKQIFPG
jgi:hypothetical protein